MIKRHFDKQEEQSRSCISSFVEININKILIRLWKSLILNIHRIVNRIKGNGKSDIGVVLNTIHHGPNPL